MARFLTSILRSLMATMAKKNQLREVGLHSDSCENQPCAKVPLVSIVTVVFNGEKYIEESIKSVLSQGCDNIEYIVIDGDSTDSTQLIIQKYENEIDYWRSESDQGQSDAFIKAFSLCNGSWITWLNADDILLPGAIKELNRSIRKFPEVDCFTGNVVWTTASNRILQCRKGERWLNLQPALGALSVYGPSTFFKRSLYERVPGINRDLHYMMDTDLWWQFYRSGAKFRRLKGYIWTLRLHEFAKMSGHNFDSSEMADSTHPSWKIKRLEAESIIERYNVETRPMALGMGKIIQNMNRLVSWAYLHSLVQSRLYKGKELHKLFPATK